MSELQQGVHIPTDEVGLLPHERRHLLQQVQASAEDLRLANGEYATAVGETGGDWAFDDPGSRDAALNAHHKEGLHRRLSKLLFLGEVAYPAADLAIVSFGTRVIVEMAGYIDSYDVHTRSLPGLPAAEGIEILSYETPLGQALMGRGAEEEIEWTTPDERVFTAILRSIDQGAQRSFYEAIIPSR